MFRRFLDLAELLKYRSILLLGPRQTGKSTYLRTHFPKAKFYNLLQADTFQELSARPELIRLSLTKNDSLIIIDEIQKLPILLDEVQAMMGDRPDLRFILTGSSARKIKRGGANLLAGRALLQRFYPLAYPEVPTIDFVQRLSRGSLPAIVDSDIYHQDLKNYVGTYLKEEIMAEGLTRGIGSFSRFLEVAALTNAKQVNYTEVGSDAGISPHTVREYYQILEDTLLGWNLPAYRKTLKRKPVATAKFYFFDIGVVNALLKRGEILEQTELYGEALEHLIFIELRTYLDYHRSTSDLTYWRSLSQIEVDFLVGEELAIEVKAKRRIARRDYKSLLTLREELPNLRLIVVCNEKTPWQSPEGVEILPVKIFLERLWEGSLIQEKHSPQS